MPFFQRLVRALRLAALGCLGVVLVVGGFFGAREAHAFIYQSDFFTIPDEGVQIAGASDALSEEALALIDEVFEDRGRNLCDLRHRMLAARLSALPRAREVEVSKIYPRNLKVQFVERRPLMVLNSERPFLVDSDGMLLAVASPQALSRQLPILTGIQDAMLAPGRSIQNLPRAMEILQAVEFIRTNDPTLDAKLVEWNINARDEVTAIMRSKTEVRFGTRPPLELLDKLSAGLEQKKELERKTYIDLRMDRQIVSK